MPELSGSRCSQRHTHARTQVLSLEAITPLWTGDVKRRSDCVRETGVLGSLRWWYEAILRSLDRRACDPVDRDDRCLFDSEGYYRASGSSAERLSRAGLCHACQAYGATGYGRPFRLMLSGGKPCFNGGGLQVLPTGRTHGWNLGAGLIGDIELGWLPLHAEFDPVTVLLPLALACRWGGLGARTQLGYGVLKPAGDSVLPLDSHMLEEWHKRLDSTDGNAGNLPDLRDFFFAEIQFTVTGDDWWREVDGFLQIQNVTHWVQNSGSVPIAPALKNWMRYGNNGRPAIGGINGKSPRDVEDWVFGKSRPEPRQRSRIHISCAYRVLTQAEQTTWEFRVWGWLPLMDGFQRDTFLNDLKGKLSNGIAVDHIFSGGGSEAVSSVKLVVWREYHSDRDREKTSTPYEFLKSLVLENDE